MTTSVNPATWDVERRILRLRLSLDLLRRNYEELLVAVRHLTSPRVAHDMIGLDDRWHRQEAMGEVLCLLHNYVASVKSLVDHTRRIYQKWYEPTGLLPSYQQEIDTRFATDPLSQFVEDLREMSQHFRLPSIRFSHFFENLPSGGRMTHRLLLTRSDLEEYRRWSLPARHFLANAGSDIDLLDLVTRHYEHVVAFHAWFRQQQDILHGIRPAVYERVTRRGLHFPEADVLAELDRRVALLTARPRESLTFPDLHESLLPGLTIWESRRLGLCEHDPGLWIDFAIGCIKRRFALSAQTEGALRALVPAST